MIFWYNNRALEKFLCMWLESFWGQEDAAALLSLSSTSGDDDAPAGGSGATRIISIYDGLPTPNNNRMNELETLFNGADQDLLNTIENYYSDRDISF